MVKTREIFPGVAAHEDDGVEVGVEEEEDGEDDVETKGTEALSASGAAVAAAAVPCKSDEGKSRW